MPTKLHFTNLKQEAEVAALIIPGSGVTHLVIHGEDHWPWHSYSAPKEEMVRLLQELLAQARAIVAGHNPLSEVDDWQAESQGSRVAGLQSRRVAGLQPGSPRLNPGATDWAWLTPEMVIAYVEQSPVLQGVAGDVRAALGKAWPAGEVPAPRVPSQLELDLETIRPHLARITAGGKINKSAIARVLGLSAGGASAWRRVTAIAEYLSSSSSEEELPPAEIALKSRGAAA